MSLEVITDINMNFSNGSGGHTASVTSSLNVKNTDGSPTLGVVGGEIGDKNLFSDSRINNLLGRFICTSKTTSKTAVGAVITRNYSDITSLTLNSYLVLVRGINAPPVDGDSYSGPVPYFSEVKGSPIDPFPSLGVKELDDKRVLVAGKIYNYETAANFQGVKISLVYHEGEPIDSLCLNKDMVQQSYIDQPDLAQYDLKFGYTLTEFLDMLEAAGIKQSGLENIEDADKIIFEASGTLASVTGTIASYFGFYYFVNPNTGVLEFIDSRIAATMPVTDFTQTTDENIVSATFTEDKFAPQDVNIYIGQTEKQGEGEKSPAKEDRPLPSFFKKVDLSEAIQAQFGEEIYASLYSCFAQNVGSATFDKYVLLLLLLQKNNIAGYDWVDFGKLFPAELGDDAKVKRSFSTDVKGNANFVINDTVIKNNGDYEEVAIENVPEGFENRVLANCEYFNLPDTDGAGNAERLQPVNLPSQTGKKGGLFEYLKGFYEFYGGFYISNGYGKYKADRMAFQNTNNLTILGPFEETKKISDIEELSDFAQFLKTYGTKEAKNLTIKDLFQSTRDSAKATSTNPFFFIGKRPWADLNYTQGNNDEVDFQVISNFVDMLMLGNQRFIGAPRAVLGQPLFDQVKNISQQSTAKFEASINIKNSLKLTYLRSKTPVNDVGEGGEEEKDNQLVGSSDANQKIAELFDRYDLKNYVIDAPKTDKYIPLNLASASGSTTEMTALRDTANKDYLTILNTPLKSSQKSVYGLEIPETFNITINSFSITIGTDGITTTIGESSLKLIPPDREFTIGRGMETIGKPLVNRRLRAAQRNYLGL